MTQASASTWLHTAIARIEADYQRSADTHLIALRLPSFAAHGIDLELAKITTLGERVEDMFLLQGAQLQHAKTQLAIEHELLEVLEAQ